MRLVHRFSFTLAFAWLPAPLRAAGTPFPVGAIPRGVAFDGANAWVGNNASNTVNKL
jgi:hypothetical protein